MRPECRECLPARKGDDRAQEYELQHAAADRRPDDQQDRREQEREERDPGPVLLKVAAVPRRYASGENDAHEARADGTQIERSERQTRERVLDLDCST